MSKEMNIEEAINILQKIKRPSLTGGFGLQTIRLQAIETVLVELENSISKVELKNDLEKMQKANPKDKEQFWMQQGIVEYLKKLLKEGE